MIPHSVYGCAPVIKRTQGIDRFILVAYDRTAKETSDCTIPVAKLSRRAERESVEIADQQMQLSPSPILLQTYGPDLNRFWSLLVLS
jgi:hypothetical protein